MYRTAFSRRLRLRVMQVGVTVFLLVISVIFIISG